YFAMAATVLLLASGAILTVQAIAGTRISRAWDVVHLLATVALLASVLPRIVTLALRVPHGARTDTADTMHAATRSFTRRTIIVAVVPLVLVPVLALFYRPVRLVNTLPKDYSYVYGKERPFAPSLARTASNAAYDARSLGGSAGCGTGGCHDRIYREWNVSAHRYSAMDAAFQKVQ